MTTSGITYRMSLDGGRHYGPVKREPLLVKTPSTIKLVLDQVREERADAKRRKSRLSNSRRRAGAPKPAHAAELYFVQAARKLVSHYAKALLPVALKAAREVAKKPARHDATQGAVSSHMRAVARRAFARGLPEFESRSKTAADRAEGHSHAELERLGLKPKKEPELKWLVDGWRKDIVSKFRGLADHHVGRLTKILSDGENRSIDSIAGDIKEQLEGVADRQAEYIARNAVQQLSSKINRHRMHAARVATYVWTTQNDARVRDEHADLDGDEFEVDGDGDDEEGHPGEAPNCRCMAFPNSPDDEGDDEAEDVEDTD